MRVFKTELSESQLGLINQVLRTGELGFGPNVQELENQFKSFSKKTHNIATNSASAAAYMIFAYLMEKHGACDVYIPTLSFASPAWAAKHHGHNVIFVDIDENLLFCSHDYRKRRVGKNKTVVMPVLYGGVSTIPDLNLKGDEIVVTDSAHCATPTINSDYTFFSFHPYKPICSSDGGIISTDHTSAAEFFKSYRNFGRKNIQDAYDITQEGFKFYMNNLNASIALESIKEYSKNLKTRKANFKTLQARVINQEDPLFNSRLLPQDKRSSYYFATLITQTNKRSLIKSIYPTQTHYPLLHKTSYFKSNNQLKFAEGMLSSIVNIPIYKTT